jgi:hypothetical protein
MVGGAAFGFTATAGQNDGILHLSGDFLGQSRFANSSFASNEDNLPLSVQSQFP